MFSDSIFHYLHLIKRLLSSSQTQSKKKKIRGKSRVWKEWEKKEAIRALPRKGTVYVLNSENKQSIEKKSISNNKKNPKQQQTEGHLSNFSIVVLVSLDRETQGKQDLKR